MKDHVESNTYVGLWWEPTNEGIRYYGTAIYDSLNGGKLVIIGTYKNISQVDIDIRTFPNIIGVEKVSEKTYIPSLNGITDLGKHITLLGCHEIEFKYTLEKEKVVYRTTYVISRMIVGIHFNNDSNKIRSLVVKYSLLDKWISNTLIGGVFNLDFGYFGAEKSNDDVFNITTDLKILVKKAPSISLSQNSNIIRNVSIVSEVDIEIQMVKKNRLEDYLEIMSIIQNFYSLLIGKPVSILETKFTTHDNPLVLPNGKAVYPEIELYQKLDPSTKFEVDFSEPLFHHIEIKGIFEILLKNYFNIHSLFKICYELFFDSFYNHGEYIHSKFLNYLHGLEALHGLYYSDKRELSKEEFTEFKNKVESLKLSTKELNMLDLEHINHISLSKKISQIIDRYPSVKKIFSNSKEIKSFIFKVVNTRNYYTHHDDKIKDKIIQDDEMYRVAMKLQLILHFYLLILIGLKPEQLESILKKFKNYTPLFVRDKIE